MSKTGKGIGFFKGVINDMKDAVDVAINKASGAKKAQLEKEIDLYDKLSKNADKFGNKETMRRQALGKATGPKMKGATRITESTGNINAIIGSKRIKKMANDIIDGQMKDRQAAIKKGLIAVSGAGLGGYVIGTALSDNKTSGAKASTKSKKTKTPPKPRSKPTPPPPKPKANPRTKNRKASKRYNIKT
jgi:hypothetical protein